jgi:ABC-type multidrug transport system fused ATPase/permease subunit
MIQHINPKPDQKHMLIKLFSLFTPSEVRQGIALMGITLVMACLDMMGVASILPFIAVLANPEVVQSKAMFKIAFSISQDFGIQNTEQFLFALGGMVFVLLVISLAFRSLTSYLQIHFALLREFSLTKRLIEGYLHQPYDWFLSRNSADLGKTILSEANVVVGTSLIPLMNLLTQSAVALALLILLVLVDPLLAISVGLFLGLSYACIFFMMSGWLERSGQVRIQTNEERFKTVSEAFSAAKEVKVGGLEEVYINRFSKPAEMYAKVQARMSVIGQLPRYALEAIAFGGMLLVTLYLMGESRDFASVLPVITLYCFAGYRLLPALQQIYQALTQLRFGYPALDALYQDLSSIQVANGEDASVTPLPLAQALTLNQVSYRYPDAPHPALKDIDLKIAAHSMVGFVGTTGSGKTTIVDLILGLLEPREGHVAVDGQPITVANRRHWQCSIGYVPQHIYLSDDSVSANIAFGVQTDKIDHAAVEHAAKIANLHHFVVNKLPQGYATAVGERGVRLSGGQRQRIGIARALYRNPQLLILDEATSALDNLTEQAVMEALHEAGHQLTIILIAHRLNTVRACNTIFLIENGELRAQGTFNELNRTDERFQAMVGSHP